MVRAEVLYKSWQLDESELAFVQRLRESQRSEMRGRVKTSRVSDTPKDSQMSSCRTNPQLGGSGADPCLG